MKRQMKKGKIVVVGVILGLLIFLLPALCYSQGGDERIEPRQKVAVLPFLLLKPEVQGERVVKGLWQDFFFRAGGLPARSGPEMTTIFHRQLNRLGRCEVIPLAQAQAVVEDMDPDIIRQDPIGAGVQIGRELGVYAVVIGGVYRFEQRQGSALGVESPASAAFDAHLVTVAEKKVSWSGRFDETQHSLSENALKISSFLKGGAQWVTVERWAAIGVESILRSFPTLPR